MLTNRPSGIDNALRNRGISKMSIKTLLAATAAISCLATAASAATFITQNNNATELAGAIAGAGVTITSASVTGEAAQFGVFTSTAAAPGIGFTSGIVLSSGAATDIPGVNAESDLTTEFGGPGDARITAIGGNPSFDAAALNFTFTLAQSTSLFFEFVFGSDEYLEFVDQGLNDAFGFFLDGGANLAVLPNGAPISINTINSTANAAFYRDNAQAAPAFDVRFDGLTTAILVTIASVAAGEHDFSFVIGDVGDAMFDSAIFIRGGSFGEQVPGEVPIPGAIPLLLTGLAGMGLIGRRKADRA